MSFLRTILTLSRLPRLPTVWSNCLAGWWLGGAGHLDELPWLFAGATLLHLGGAFLNDAFDADFDRLHRPGRPISSGAITQNTVWRWGLGWLVAGGLLLLARGTLTGILGMTLISCIVLYNTVHRLITVAPLLKGICRCLFYIAGASLAQQGVSGPAIWCGLAVAAYTAGVRYLARMQDQPPPVRYWPAVLLATPIGLALIMDVGDYREGGLLLSAVLAIWILRSLRPAFWSPEPNVRRAVSGLVAGIIFVDWLAMCPVLLSGHLNDGPRQISFACLALFAATLVLQRLVPDA
jgi:hypothetical protein